MLRGKLTAMNAYIKNPQRFQINNIMMYLMLLEKQEEVKLKSSGQKEIIKIRTEISKET
jgi:hypothetical protein